MGGTGSGTGGSGFPVLNYDFQHKNEKMPTHKNDKKTP